SGVYNLKGVESGGERGGDDVEVDVQDFWKWNHGIDIREGDSFCLEVIVESLKLPITCL
ncbi:hypothetical protein A2U01_0036689, partial [Trifolium medium]|nr:hypothetical protein [Trifolium medium]